MWNLLISYFFITCEYVKFAICYTYKYVYYVWNTSQIRYKYLANTLKHAKHASVDLIQFEFRNKEKVKFDDTLWQALFEISQWMEYARLE